MQNYVRYHFITL